MPTPQVNAQTGVVTNGPIYVNQVFDWVSNVACTVSAPVGDLWFSPSPASITIPPGKVQVTATLANEAPGWTYFLNGNSPYGNPKIPVKQAK